MAVHASHSALPYPIKGARFSMLVPFLDADGDPTAQTTPDTEISEDNGAATDAAEEMSATSGMDGMALITLTGAETDCSCLAVNAKAASGPKATLATLYPRVLASVGTGTLSAGSASGGTLGTLLAYDVTGCFIKTTGGTGGGGTGGANNQARKIITYNTSTGAFTVEPAWETTPDNTTTYDVLLPEGVTLGMLKTLNPTTAGRTLTVESDGMAHADVKEWIGTAVTLSTGNKPDVNVDEISDDATATATLELFVEALDQATGQIDNGSFAAGAIDAAAIANGAIDAATFAADVDAEVLSYIVDDATRIDASALNTASATTIPAISAIFTGITSLAQWLGLIAGKQTGNSTARTELRATGAGSGTYDETTDSQEAIRDNMGTAQTGDNYARLGAPVGASIAADIAAVQADLPQRITKNTALAAFEFTMVDSADHVTGKTGLTITATRSLDGAAFASCANSATEVSNGVYKIDLAAGDLNGNTVTLKFAATGADTRMIHIVTQPT